MWIDCDVGQDDVFAIILGVFSKELNILGISTSYGNSALENTTNNTLSLLTALGNTTIPVYKGMEKPFLNRKSMRNTKTHGASGLAGTDLLPKPSRTFESIHAVTAMEQVFSRMNDNSVSLVVTGPLTNTAFLIAMHPNVTDKIKQIVIMGGAIGMGMTTPTSEMNIVSDPESAEAVFGNNRLTGKIVLIPLETTHTAIATQAVMSAMVSKESNFRRMLHGLVSHFARGYAEIYGFLDGPPIHDPLTIFYLLHPEVFKTKLVKVSVVLGGLADGETVCDIFHKRTGEVPNVHVSQKTDPDLFWRTMLAAIDAADIQSTIN